MKRILPTKTPAAAVWKVAFRILGISLLCFLFTPDGRGEGESGLQAFDVNDKSMTENVALTYRNESGTNVWYYKVGVGGTETQFSGTLTGGTNDKVSDYYFTINNEVAGQAADLTLKNFTYNGSRGVFQIKTGKVNINVSGKSSLTHSESSESLDEKCRSVIHVASGSELTLDGGNDGITITNNQKVKDIYGLYNAGTTTLCGKIDFAARNGTEEGTAYAIYTSGTLKADQSAGKNTAITAVGDPVYSGAAAKYESPFISWCFENAPAKDVAIIIRKAGETDAAASFLGDGESKAFLSPVETGVSYIVEVDGKSQHGRKQTDVDTYETSYMKSFDAAQQDALAAGSGCVFYGHLASPSETLLDLSALNAVTTVKLHYKKVNDQSEDYAWFYTLDSGSETEFSGTLTGENKNWTDGTISVTSAKSVTSSDGSDYPVVKLKKVTLESTSTSPLIKMENNSQPVCIQANGKSTLTGEGHVIKCASLVLDGGTEGLEITGTGNASHGIHLTATDGKALLAGKLTVNASVPVYLDSGAKLSAKDGAQVILSSSSDEAITASASLDSPFLEWRFGAGYGAGPQEVKDGSGNPLDPPVTLPADAQRKSFAINATAGASYTLWVYGDEQQKGNSPNGTEYTVFQASPGEKLTVYASVTTCTPRVFTFDALTRAIASASTDPEHPTDIWLGADITLTGSEGINLAGKYIRMDGKGNMITPNEMNKNFYFPADGSGGSLELTNITVGWAEPPGDKFGQSTSIKEAFIDVHDENAKVTLSKGFVMQNIKSDPTKAYGVNMAKGTLIMEKGALIRVCGEANGFDCVGRIESPATLILNETKLLHRGYYYFYLLNNGDKLPTVKIGSEFKHSISSISFCLSGYIDEKGDVPAGKVIEPLDDYKIQQEDLDNLKVPWICTSTSTDRIGGYGFYPDKTSNAFKLEKSLLIILPPTFEDVEEGYSQPNSKSIYITYTSGKDGSVSYTFFLELENSNDGFEELKRNDLSINNYSCGNEISIQPKAGLPPGTYKATFTVKGYDDKDYTAQLSFTVKSKSDPDPDPDPDPIPDYVYYQVVLPKVTGATTDPMAGTYLVGEGDAFRFKLTLDDDYNLSAPVVMAGTDVLQPDAYGYYLLPNVWHDRTITVSGITLNPVDPVDPPSANADLDEPVKVWAEGHTLYIYTATRETIRLYTFSGQLLRQMDNAGRIGITGLPEGNYLIRVGDRSWKVGL